MHLVTDEWSEARDIVDVEAQSLSANRFKYIVERRLFDETDINGLDMGKVGHQFQFDPDEDISSHSWSCTNRRLYLILPENDRSSSKTGNPLDTAPLPTRMVSTIFGFTCLAAWRGVVSSRSLGVKDKAQSMMTTSSGLLMS